MQVQDAEQRYASTLPPWMARWLTAWGGSVLLATRDLGPYIRAGDLLILSSTHRLRTRRFREGVRGWVRELPRADAGPLAEAALAASTGEDDALVLLSGPSKAAINVYRACTYWRPHFPPYVASLRIVRPGPFPLY